MNDRTEWFAERKWGVFVHYLVTERSPRSWSTSSDEWNRMIDEFDVARTASQVADVGAGYFFITIGQTSGHYCAPNETYDRIVGVEPSKCSRRDLVLDLYEELESRGVRLMVYVPSDGSCNDDVARDKLGWESNWTADWGSPIKGLRLAGFQRNWEAVISEWSLRWGNKACGWWVDGCYFSDVMYRHPDEPNFGSFASALKAGNPESILAFNTGVSTPVVSKCQYDDYTAGEISKALPECPGPWVEYKGHMVRYHILSYLGGNWSRGEPRFPAELAAGYTRHVISKGGVVTWDVPTDVKGVISDGFMKQLEKIGQVS